MGCWPQHVLGAKCFNALSHFITKVPRARIISPFVTVANSNKQFMEALMINYASPLRIPTPTLSSSASR